MDDDKDDLVVDPACLSGGIHATIILMAVHELRNSGQRKPEKKRKFQAVVTVAGTRYVMDLRNDGDGVDRVIRCRKAHYQ